VKLLTSPDPINVQGISIKHLLGVRVAPCYFKRQDPRQRNNTRVINPIISYSCWLIYILLQITIDFFYNINFYNLALIVPEIVLSAIRRKTSPAEVLPNPDS
jgi:hypothetical protein